MSDFLSGNYKLPKNKTKIKNDSKISKVKTITEEMEEEALSKLGGSICFVTKSDTLMWNGSDEKTS
ncbi:MAG: hypothetical protein ACJ0A6_00915 [Dehalococcoidia bacterium]